MMCNSYMFVVVILLLKVLNICQSLKCEETSKITKLPSIYETGSPDVKRALHFIDSVMNPPGCSNLTYVMVNFNPLPAGFAAQFQFYAYSWLQAAVATNYTVPILIKYGFRYYTQSPECKMYSDGRDHERLDCLFEPLSTCEQQLLRNGTQLMVDFPDILQNLDVSIPPLFKHLGFQLWWGIVQARIFRLQPTVYQDVLTKAREMKNCVGFPFGSSVAGLHVRHGDKRNDGFREHTYEQQLVAAFNSPECKYLKGGVCYTSNDQSLLTYENEIKVFVASDDEKVLQSASSNGHFNMDIGFSQHTGSGGMFAALIRNPALGYNASIEIIRDIFFLSHCSTLIGNAGSQVFRMAVAMANASGILKYAAAVDFDQIPRVAQLSRKYDVVFVENFMIPNYTRPIY